MNRIKTAALGLAASAVIAGTGAPIAAHAESAKPAPCAQQQTQVDKAEAALARVTAVFNKDKHAVKVDKKAVAQAKGPNAKANAKAKLATAKAKLAKAAKAKKAQQQRLAHAEARLAACQAAQPSA